MPDSSNTSNETLHAGPPTIDGEPLVSYLTEGQLKGMYERAQSAIEAQARASVERLPEPDWPELIAFYASLVTESDRAIPVLAFAYIDTEMEQALRASMSPSVSGGLGQLFGPLGPLGSAAARINLAHGLNWIGDALANDLHLLRRIRNSYAHERMPPDLGDEAVTQRILNHQGFQTLLTALFSNSALEVNWSKQLDAVSNVVPVLHPNSRNRLILASAISAWNVSAQLYVAPRVQRHGVEPVALLQPDAPEAPAGIRNQGAAFRGFVNTLLNLMCCPTRVESVPDLDEWASTFQFGVQQDSE